MVQIANGAFSTDKDGVRVPMWDDPTVWTTNFLGKVTTQPRIAHWYQNWHDAKKDWNATRINTLTARGEQPIISWAPRDPTKGSSDTTYNLASINAGNHDAYIDDWGTKAAAYGKPLIIRPMWEMNSTVYSWGIGVQGQTGADYIAAFRRMVDRFRAKGATNVKWCFCPLAEGTFPIDSMYPGDAYIDWIGLDGYNNMGTTWRTPADVFDSAYTSITTSIPSKRFMLSEVGCMEAGGDKAAWITDLYNRVQTTWPKTEAIVWFDSDGSSLGEKDWRINSTQLSLDSYNASIDNPQNMGHIESGVQFIKSLATTQATASNSIAASIPTGLVADDVLIMSVGAGAAQGFTVPNDWTLFAQQTDRGDNSTGDSRQNLYWKRTTGTEAATVTVADISTNNRNWDIVISVWRGCLTTAPPVEGVATSGLNAAITAGSTITMPASVSEGRERRFVSSMYIRDTTATAVPEISWAVDFTEKYEVSIINPTLNSQTNSLAEHFRAETGTVTPTLTITNAQMRYVAATFALVPEPTQVAVLTKIAAVGPISTSLVSGLTPTDSASATGKINDDPDNPNNEFLVGADPSGASTTDGPEWVDAHEQATGLVATTWTNPANLTDLSDGTAGTFSVSNKDTDYGTFFSWSGADFSNIPTGAAITGVSVTIRTSASSNSRLSEWLQLGASNGSPIGAELAVNSGSTITTTATDYTLNSWSALPTRDQLVSGTFGVRLRMRKSNFSLTASVFSIKATVTYTLPGTTTPIEVRVNMGDPIDPLAKTSNVNGDLHLQVRKKGTGTSPPVNVDLYEAGVFLKRLVSGTIVSSTVSQLVTADFDHNLITDPTAVQFWITSPGAEGGLVEVGAIEWNAEVLPPVYDLAWDANTTDADFDHFNVYRSTVSTGPYSKLNSDKVPTPAYTDFSGTTGVTYYYSVSSVDSVGNESALSAPVQPTEPVAGTTYTQTMGVIVLTSPSMSNLNRFKRALAVVGTSTVNITKRIGKRITVSGAGTPVMLKRMTNRINATGIGSANFIRRMGLRLSVGATGTVNFVRGLSITRLLAVTATGTATTALAKRLRRTLTVTSTGVVSILKGARLRILVSAIGTPSIRKGIATRILVTASGVASTTLRSTLRRALTVVASGSTSVGKAVRTRLLATAIGASDLTRRLSLRRAMSATAVGSANIIKRMSKAMQVVASGAVSLSARKAILITLQALASGTSTLRKGLTASLSAIATGLAGLTRRLSLRRLMAVTGVGTPELRKRISTVLSASATGTAVVNTLKVILRTLSATASGAVSVRKAVSFRITVLASGLASTTTASMFRRALTVLASGTATVRKLMPVSLIASATVVVNMLKRMMSTLSTTASGTANIRKGMAASLSAAATGISSVVGTTMFRRTLTVVASGTAMMRKRMGMTISANTAVVANMFKGMIRTLTATSTGTANIRKGMAARLSALATGVSSLSTTSMFRRAFTAVATGTAELRKLLSVRLNATATGTAVVNRLKVILRTLTAAASGTVTIRKGVATRLSAIANGVASTVTTSMFRRALSVVAGGAVTLRKYVSTRINATATGTATMNILKVILRTLAATASGVASFRRSIAYRISVSATGTASFARRLSLSQLLSAGATGAASLRNRIGKMITATATGSAALGVAERMFYATLEAVASGSATFRKGMGKTMNTVGNGGANMVKDIRITWQVGTTGTSMFLKNVGKHMSAVGTGSAVFSPKKVLLLVISAIATGTPNIVKRMFKSFAATGTGTPSMIKLTWKTLASTAVGAASLRKGLSKIISAVGSGTASTTYKGLKLVILSAAATGSVTVRKAISKIVQVNAIGTTSMRKGVSTLMSVTASGIPQLGAKKAVQLLLSALSTGTANMTRAVSYLRTLATQANVTVGTLRHIGKTMSASAQGAASFTRRLTMTMQATANAVSSMVAALRPQVTKFIHPIMILATKQKADYVLAVRAKIDQVLRVKDKIQAILRTFSE